MNRQEEKEDELRFIADTMLVEVARWLRILGYDTLYSRTYTDKQLLMTALRTGRILLTRDRGLYIRARKKGARVVFIESDKITYRLAELLYKVKGLKYEPDPAKSRCPECNSPLVVVRDKSRVKDRVPPGALNTYGVFYLCPRCGRVYWEGGHWRNIRRIVEEAKRLVEEIRRDRAKTGRPGRARRQRRRIPSKTGKEKR
jgi:uncharacterized protein with PIN domain